MADTFSTETFLNSSIEHAGIIFSNIFRKAENYIYIYAGDLNGGISSQNQYWFELLNFLSKNKSEHLKILLSKYNPDNIPDLFFRINEPEFISKIEVKYIDKPVMMNEKEFHFCVADGLMYRLETDVELFLAQGSFNNVDVSKSLETIFENLFKTGKPIDICNFSVAI